MTLILLWIASSALIGWLGRKRLIGFWGFFVLSLIFSPILMGLFLVLGAPSKKRYVEEVEQSVAASFRRAGFAKPQETRITAAREIAAPIAAHSRTPGVRRLAGAWIAVVIVFAGVYFVAVRLSATTSLASESFGVMDAVRISVDVATLGSGGPAVAEGRGLAWLAIGERLLVLVIFVLLVSNLISAQLAAWRAKDQIGDRSASTSVSTEPTALSSKSAMSIAQVAEPEPAERPTGT